MALRKWTLILQQTKGLRHPLSVGWVWIILCMCMLTLENLCLCSVFGIYIIVMFYSMYKTSYLCLFLFLAFALSKVHWVMFVTALTLLNYMNFFFLHQPSCSRKVCGTFETVPFEVCSLFSLVFNYSQYLVQQCVDHPWCSGNAILLKSPFLFWWIVKLPFKYASLHKKKRKRNLWWTWLIHWCGF